MWKSFEYSQQQVASIAAENKELRESVKSLLSFELTLKRQQISKQFLKSIDRFPRNVQLPKLSKEQAHSLDRELK